MKQKIKTFLINYYLIFIFIFLVLINSIVNYVVIKGLLYYIAIILIIILNFFMILKHDADIKFKSLFFILFTLSLLFDKTSLYRLISLSSLIAIIITGFCKNKFIMVSTYVLVVIVGIAFPLIFLILLTPGEDPIYEDMHYYCDKYEIYSYSYGAMDSFHYKVNKHLKIIYIKNIIEISYNEVMSDSDSNEQYYFILKNNKCILSKDYK